MLPNNMAGALPVHVVQQACYAVSLQSRPQTVMSPLFPISTTYVLTCRTVAAVTSPQLLNVCVCVLPQGLASEGIWSQSLMMVDEIPAERITWSHRGGGAFLPLSLLPPPAFHRPGLPPSCILTFSASWFDASRRQHAHFTLSC